MWTWSSGRTRSTQDMIGQSCNKRVDWDCRTRREAHYKSAYQFCSLLWSTCDSWFLSFRRTNMVPGSMEPRLSRWWWLGILSLKGNACAAYSCVRLFHRFVSLAACSSTYCQMSLATTARERPNPRSHHRQSPKSRVLRDFATHPSKSSWCRRHWVQ